MAISLNTQLKQTQRLAMTQALRQQIEMLQLSALELADAVNAELESNPVLEIDERSAPEPLDGGADDLSRSLERELSHDMTDSYSAMAEYDETVSFDGDEDKKRQFIENAVTKCESLAEHILEQIRMITPDGKMIQLVEKIVTSLDEHGLFTVDHRAFELENGISSDELSKAIALIQTCEPIGCASSSAREALLVQSRIQYPDDEVLHRTISEHFELLSGFFHEKIARALSVTADEVREKGRIVQTLNPYPGRGFSTTSTKYVVPDIEVSLVDGEIIIVFNDEFIPRIRISTQYADMLSKKDIDKKLKEYIKDRMGSAKQLMRNIAGRRETIGKVVRAIMQHQIAFLEKGPGRLKPLTYAQIAEIAECHESTVSRVSSNKYMRCQWGTFELRYFFASKIRSGAEEHSSDEALSLIRDIVARERPESPCSDDEIAAFLKGAGLTVARRTVAKYRDILNIPSSNKRKRLNLLKAEGGEL
jgi:RNA polymerase sigma-54 factor